MTQTKITIKYILAIVVAVLFTWIIHELAHWITYKFLGYESLMTLNSVSVVNNQNPTISHSIMISITGPLITIFQAVVVYSLLKFKKWNSYLYPFLLTPFYMRFLAGLINFINPNDEGRISEYLGIGLFTISIIVSSFLFFLVYNISKKYHLKFKFQMITVIVIMVVSSFIIISDQYFKIQVL